MKTTEEHLQTFGVIPVVVLNDEENAVRIKGHFS